MVALIDLVGNTAQPKGTRAKRRASQVAASMVVDNQPPSGGFAGGPTPPPGFAFGTEGEYGWETTPNLSSGASAYEPTWSPGTEYGAGPGGIYTDQSGYISFDAGVTWLDPRTQQVWNPQASGQQWSTVPDYNAGKQAEFDYAQSLGNPTGDYTQLTGAFPGAGDYSRITPQQFTGIDRAITEYEENPITSAMESGYKVTPQDFQVIDRSREIPKISKGDYASAAMFGADPYEVSKADGGLSFSDLYNKYTRAVTPIYETGAQIAAGVLGSRDPSTGLPSRGAYERGAKGVTDLGSSVRESGGNPLTFGEIQNRKFAERPAWEQAFASTVFDPTNLLGAGVVTKGLTGVKGAGTASKILRGAGTVNKALDVAQTKAALPIVGGIAGYGVSTLSG